MGFELSQAGARENQVIESCHNACSKTKGCFILFSGQKKGYV